MSFRKILGPAGGTQYVYDFEEMTCGQVEDARSLFEFHNEKMFTPPQTAREFIVAGAADVLLRAYSYLFRKALKEGATERADPEDVYTWLRDLPSSYHADLEEIKKDFFTRKRIRDVGWLQRTRRVLSVVADLQSNLQRSSGPSASATSQEQPDDAPLFIETANGGPELEADDTAGGSGYLPTEEPLNLTE